jgi:hypothetical protein
MTKTNRLSLASVCCGLLLLTAGCGLLDTDQPNTIDPGDLDTPEGAEAKRVGALADFTLAQDGDGNDADAATEGYIMVSGLLSDEFVFSSTPPSQQEVDQRAMIEINPTLFGVYHTLHRARRAAEDAAASLENFSVDGPLHPGVAEMLTLAGFTYVYFAEGFCSGVAYSERVNGEPVFGDPETTAETLARAIARFDAALASPGAAPEEINAAAVGKGRALLNDGQYAAAAAAVSGVPDDFEYLLEHAPSPLRLRNSIYLLTNGGQWSIADGEGGNGLDFRNGDSRVPFIDEQAPGLDNSTPQFSLIKFPDVGASVPLASGLEARLIEAEAQFQAGDTATMLLTLNALRSAASLPDLVGPTTLAEARDLVFRERAFWLFSTGHRLGDMRRLTRSTLYGLPITGVFPESAYHKDGVYGTDVNLPLPLEERNNPNVNGCLDRDP